MNITLHCNTNKLKIAFDAKKELRNRQSVELQYLIIIYPQNIYCRASIYKSGVY